VSDVKRFRLNAKREHLRSRIETCLSLQAKFGLICETCSRIVLALSKQAFFIRFQQSSRHIQGIRTYCLWRLELRTIRVDLPQSTRLLPYGNNEHVYHRHRKVSRRKFRHTDNRDYVTCEVGYYREHTDRACVPLLQDNDCLRSMKKIDELRDMFEKSNVRIHHELRKLIMSLQSDFDDIKRKLVKT
jgi:hypothetical protein